MHTLERSFEPGTALALRSDDEVGERLQSLYGGYPNHSICIKDLSYV